MDLRPPDEETMVSTAVADLEKQFVAVDHAQIEATVRYTVHAWLVHARVKAFVGVIAERHAREKLQRLVSEQATA